MGPFIASLPKPVIALAVILFGFVIIVLNDPPKTVCDAQLELFKVQQREFLYEREGANKTKLPGLAKELFTLCQSSNSPGGCFELFTRLKKMNQDLDHLPRQCSEAVAVDEAIRTWSFGSLKLMAQIAWGDRGPASIMRRGSWFDASDMTVFCDLKQHVVRIYGADAYDMWQAGVIQSLPESEKRDGDQAFQESLFAASCGSFR